MKLTRHSRTHWKSDDPHVLIDRLIARGFLHVDSTRPTELAKLTHHGSTISVSASGYALASGTSALNAMHQLESEVR